MYNNNKNKIQSLVMFAAVVAFKVMMMMMMMMMTFPCVIQLCYPFVFIFHGRGCTGSCGDSGVVSSESNFCFVTKLSMTF